MRASRFHGWLFRRYGPRRRLFQGLFIIFVLFTFVEILYVRHRLQTVDDLEQIQSVHTSERIYIASIHWNNEPILRSHWNEAVIQLAKTWGPKNIFVSVLESGSWDDTKGALHMLDVELGKIGVSRNITLSEITHQDEILRSPSEDGWIETPRGQLELRRIPYLSQLRNKALRPLLELAQEGIFFDKILFLNDVVFTVCPTSRGTPSPWQLGQLTNHKICRLRTWLPYFKQTTVYMLQHARWISLNRLSITILLRCAITREKSTSCKHGLISARQSQEMLFIGCLPFR